MEIITREATCDKKPIPTSGRMVRDILELTCDGEVSITMQVDCATLRTAKVSPYARLGRTFSESAKSPDVVSRPLEKIGRLVPTIILFGASWKEACKLVRMTTRKRHGNQLVAPARGDSTSIIKWGHFFEAFTQRQSDR